jgi:hypothetical protein
MNNRVASPRPEHRPLPALFLVALLLSACTLPPPVLIVTPAPPTPPPTPLGETGLAFESIDRDDWGPHGYSGKQPAVVVVTSRQQIDERLDGMVQDSTLEQVQRVDFGQYFVVAVFRGVFAYGAYSVTIRRVARRGDRLVVYAELPTLGPNSPKPPAATSPCHLVRVQRDGHPLADQDAILVTWVTYE